MDGHEFLWGAATSSHQIDGNNKHSDWWHWEARGYIEGGDRSGLATDHWHRCEEDIARAASLGLNSYRFSVEWARVEPVRGKFDESVLEWYRRLVGLCERHNLIPMATLHHFTMPQWFAEIGEFTVEESPELFLSYVRKVLGAIGDRIPLWITLNEPMNVVLGKYLASFMPPAVVDPRKASVANRNLLRAHALAYDAIHAHAAPRVGKWAHLPVAVGIAHAMVDFVPLSAWNPIERLMTRVFKRYYNRAWLDAVTGQKQHFGVSGLVPYPEPVSECLGRRTVDFLGLNYYMKLYVSAQMEKNTANLAKTLPIGVKFAVDNEPTSDMGWAVHPSGLGRMLRFLQNYELPIYITENGIADEKDRLRPRYLLAHLAEVSEQIASGVDVRGYYYWSLLDNFEWIKGFGPRFGLIEVDYRTMERRERPSADLYRRIIKLHRDTKAVTPDSILIREILRMESHEQLP